MNEIIEYRSYEDYKAALDMEMSKTAEGFVRIGYLLKVARDTDILQQSAYTNLNDFAKAEYGIDPSTVSRFININDRFSEGGYSQQLTDQFKGFGYAKLSIMLTLPDAVNQTLTTDFSKAEIKEIQQEVKADQEEAKKITPIQLYLEGQEPATETMNDLQMVIYELGKDFDVFQAVHEAVKNADILDIAVDVASAMAPDDVKAYFVRLKGIGRRMLSVDVIKRVAAVVNVRENDRKEYSLEDLLEAWGVIGLDPGVGPLVNHNEIYHTFEEEKESKIIPMPAPKEDHQEGFKEPKEEPKEEPKKAPKKESKVSHVKPPKQEKRPEPKKEEKIEAETDKSGAGNPEVGKESEKAEGMEAGSSQTNAGKGLGFLNPPVSEADIRAEEPEAAVVEADEQLSGQADITDYPEFMPDGSEIASAPTEENIDAQMQQYEGSIAICVDELEEAVRARDYKKARITLDTIKNHLIRMEKLEWRRN